jgi:uncharacterized protein YgbK (DUF1537 family)
LRSQEIFHATAALNVALQKEQDVVLYTSRRVITGRDGRDSLAICCRVSDAIVEILRGVKVRPRYIVGKGGITSSDITTKALGVRRAMVLGQILSGIPAWRLGEESRWPGLIYISFPGNFGGPETLAELAQKLSR